MSGVAAAFGRAGLPMGVRSGCFRASGCFFRLFEFRPGSSLEPECSL